MAMNAVPGRPADPRDTEMDETLPALAEPNRHAIPQLLAHSKLAA